MGKMRFVFNHRGVLGNKDKTIKFVNGSEITLVNGAGNSSGIRSNSRIFKDENGNAVEMDMRDNSYRVIHTKEELEEDFNGEL